MCGMAGFITAQPQDRHTQYLGYLLALNGMDRGMDSTGLFDYCHNAKSQVEYVKSTQDAISFLQNFWPKAREERWKEHRPTCVAIHTRAATQGKVNKANSHPFHFPGLLGMHNGTIKEKFRYRDKFDTDSEALYYNVHQHGIEDTVTELEKKSAAFALVWFDVTAKTLNLLRNYERPLHYCMLDKDKTMFWSSDRAHLEAVLKNWFPQKTSVTIEALPQGKWRTYQIKKGQLVVTEKDIEVCKTYSSSTFYPVQNWSGDSKPWKKYTNLFLSDVEKMQTAHDLKEGLAVLKKAAWSVYTDYYHIWNNRLERWCTKTQDDVAKAIYTKLASLSDDVVHYIGFQNTVFDKVQYADKLKFPCDICQQAHDDNLDQFIFWRDHTHYICETCAEDILTDSKDYYWLQGGITQKEMEIMKTKYNEEFEEEYNTYASH